MIVDSAKTRGKTTNDVALSVFVRCTPLDHRRSATYIEHINE
jgi:hypothetical protein